MTLPRWLLMLGSVAGIGLCTAGTYLILRQHELLAQRERFLSAIAAAQQANDDAAILTAADGFLAVAPRHSNAMREQWVIAAYDRALTRWIAGNLSASPEIVQAKIVAFEHARDEVKRRGESAK